MHCLDKFKNSANYTELKYSLLVNESDKAWKIRLKNNTIEIWLPKSKCLLDIKYKIVYVPNWIMEKKKSEITSILHMKNDVNNKLNFNKNVENNFFITAGKRKLEL